MPETIARQTPFTIRVQAATTGDPATSLKLWQDSVLVGEQPVDATGKADFPYPDGLPKGSYLFEAAGVNADGESDKAILTLVVTGKPPDRPSLMVILP